MFFTNYQTRILKGLLTLFVCSCSALSAKNKYNILYIMTDDHAAHAIGAYGGRFAKLNPTPTIDKLAEEGVLLENCFATNAICTPSRATIMTSQYSHLNKCKGFYIGLKPENQTLPQLIKKQGYETAVIGKWHLLEEPAPFDYYAVLSRQGNYFNPIFRIRGDKPWPDSELNVFGYDSIHSSDAITDLSIKWLKERKSKDKPFFLFHQFKAPHDNFENAERYDWLYTYDTMPRPDSLTKRGNHGPKGSSQYGTSVGKRNERRNMGHHMFVDPEFDENDYIEESYQRYMKKYFRTVKGVDDNIARLLEHLKQTGELENTIIIYTSDQGFMLGEHDYIDKRWMYEEAMRMPFIIRFPDKSHAGTRNKDITINADFTPTLLELAGMKEEDFPDSFQGRSFLNNVKGETPADWPKEMYYRYWLHMAHHDNPAHLGVRTETEKLIYFYGLAVDVIGAVEKPTEPYFEYYNLVEDPKEMNNRIDDPAMQENIKKLKKKIVALREKYEDTDKGHEEMQKRLAEAGLVK